MWVHARGGRSVNTNRAYRRAGTRLLEWLKEQGLSLSAMTVADAQAHLDALRRPSVDWLIPRDQHGVANAAGGRSRKQSLRGPLSDKGVRYARTLLTQLFGYLYDAGYVRRNVFGLTQVPPTVVADVADRVLVPRARRYLWNWLLEHDEGRTDAERMKAARNRWVFALLYYSGIRPSEAVAGLMRDFVLHHDGWQLRVIGKGAKLRRVTVNAALGRELIQFRRALGLVGWPSPTDETPLVPALRSVRGGHFKGITVRMLDKLVTASAARAAADCQDQHVQHQLRSMSPYWFRHTAGTDRMRAGARLETTQQELGHADPKTSLVYVQISDKARREDAERFGDAAIGDTE